MPRPRRKLSYRFKDLEALSAFFRAKAGEARAESLVEPKHPVIVKLLKNEAIIWDEAALIVQNTELK